MREISSLHIRMAAAIALCSIVLFTYLNVSTAISYDQQAATARTWNYLGALVPIRALAIYYLLWNILAVVGLVGTLWFWRPARWIVAVTVVAAVFSQPLSGLLVLSAPERAVWTVMAVSMTWLVAVCFLSPIASRFNREPQQRVT
jgi:hypothetical protein